MNFNYSPALGPRLVRDGLITQFTVADVGASGGIATHWNSLDPAFVGVGFDTLVGEVARLNDAARHPKVTYVPALLGYRTYADLVDTEGKRWHDFFHRTSSVRAQQENLAPFDASYDASGSGETVTELTEIDDYFPDGAGLDFLKTDTDGSDIAVLLGAQKAMKTKPILGLQVEVAFHGWIGSQWANNFANVDRFLRSLGYSLFDMYVNRYSRAALPGVFEWNNFSSTDRGQLHWADVLYLRDVAEVDYEAIWGLDFTAEQILRLACIFELYNLQDCAAELLLKFRERIGCEIEGYLNLLTPEIGGQKLPYREYDDLFRRDAKAFYRRNAARAEPSVQAK